ncbi:DUF3035 domain-containing protein [Sphingomonas gilva]|uniref:DUF3035 domain-containing protein n=1 Tax=Sphingomonas gilva TaxID=2305907 RepID=A0A396RNJ3_9SPHN|nr:DUF3035 domain-containing protein [Sphingomonas gilva]RHW17978.1 DUF3035 domain-containing protein [Sphingomonas gilva]
MRKALSITATLAIATLLAACGGSSGLNRDRPDEFAVARQAPLVIPPDYSLTPPTPGAPRPQDTAASTQALRALFGGPAPRSAAESAALNQAGIEQADAGVRSAVGDPQTTVVDKGSVTRDIIAAPEGDGQNARANPGGTPAPAAEPAPAATTPPATTTP